MSYYEKEGFSQLFIISLENSWYKVFNMVVTLCCLFSSYIYAYIAAFRLHEDLNESILSSQYIFETIFLLHMILQFFLEFCPESTNVPVIDLKKIAVHYLEGEFKGDMIAILPLFQLIVFLPKTFSPSLPSHSFLPSDFPVLSFLSSFVHLK